jgi:hypothetical protein
MMETKADQNTRESLPEDGPSLAELRAALIAAGVRPPTRKLSEWQPVRERPAWRAFLARHFGI